MQKYLTLNDLASYKLAFHLSNQIWEIVIVWKNFEKDTVGKQFVRAVDSISANIAEGFGRYGKKDKIHFYRYAFGSVMESLDWNEKAFRRDMLTKKEYESFLASLKQLQKEINHLIRFTNAKLSI
jgi:four helix bundle protein